MVKRPVKCKVIINACSTACSDRAFEIAAFIEAHSHIIEPGNDPIEALAFYADELPVEDQVGDWPFMNIHLIKIKHYQPETILAVLQELEETSPADLYLFSADMAGNELAVRFAWRLKGSSLVAAEKLARQKEELLGIKKVYSGNLSGSFLFRKKPYCLSLARGMEKVIRDRPGEPTAVTYLDYTREVGNQALIHFRETSVREKQPLDKARFIIAVGRGAGNINELKRLEKIAYQMGAELGVSRPVAMNAWAPLSRLIGASGKVLSPEICLVIAASGSPPFYYGIEKSKKIIAINTDENAPIIKTADLVIVDDYREIISTLLELFENDQPG